MGCANIHYDLEAPRHGLFENIGVSSIRLEELTETDG